MVSRYPVWFVHLCSSSRRELQSVYCMNEEEIMQFRLQKIPKLPWKDPIVLATEKSRVMRMIVDCDWPNKFTEMDDFLILRINDIPEVLRETKYFRGRCLNFHVDYLGSFGWDIPKNQISQFVIPTQSAACPRLFTKILIVLIHAIHEHVAVFPYLRSISVITKWFLSSGFMETSSFGT